MTSRVQGVTVRAGGARAAGNINTVLSVGATPGFPASRAAERRSAHARHYGHGGGGGSTHPQSSDFLIFSLGFASVVSLVFITGDLLGTRPIKPVTITVFVLSTSYCGVLVRRQRVANSEHAGTVAAVAAARAAAVGGVRGSREIPPRVLDKETRHRLLEYFVLRRPEEEKGNTVEEKGIPFAAAAASAAAAAAAATGQGREAGGTLTLDSEGDAVKRGAPPLRPPPPPYMTPPPAYMSPSNLCLRSMLVLGSAGKRGRGERNAGGWGAGGGVGSGSEQERPPAFSGGGGSVSPGGVSDRDHQGIAPAWGEDDDSGDKESGVLSTKPSVSARGNSGEWFGGGVCIICFGDYSYGEELCLLPCRHVYHAPCIDEWFDGANHAWCPLCKYDVRSASSNNGNAGDAADGRDISAENAV